MSGRIRKWAGCTLFNYSDSDEKQLEQLVNNGTITYLIYGREICSTTGRKHLQAYWETKTKRTRQGMKKILLNKQWHLEAKSADSTIEECQTYSKKEGDFVEFGVPMVQGARTDIARMQADILNGMLLPEIAHKYCGLFLRYRANIQAYMKLMNRTTELKYSLENFALRGWTVTMMDRSLILWGAPGIGKTEFAKALIGKNYLWVRHLDGLKNYDASFHTGIVFDDLSFLHLPREAQIHLVDWDNESEIHLRFYNATIPAGTRKVFTTNVSGGRIFNLEDGAIHRRVQIEHLLVMDDLMPEVRGVPAQDIRHSLPEPARRDQNGEVLICDRWAEHYGSS